MGSLDDDDDLGPCTVCDHGWITVGGGYVDDHARLPDHLVMAAEERERLVRVRRIALADSVYPCRRCRPRQFFRWVKGCGTVGHDAEACDLCQREAEREPTVRRRRR